MQTKWQLVWVSMAQVRVSINGDVEMLGWPRVYTVVMLQGKIVCMLHHAQYNGAGAEQLRAIVDVDIEGNGIFCSQCTK
jgi:hypothetical protein